MAKHIKPSVLPIYLVGVVCWAMPCCFRLKSAASYGICAVLSLVAFIAGKAVFPDKAFELAGEKEDRPKEEPKKEKTTGDPAIDALIRERDRALSEMRRINDALWTKDIRSDRPFGGCHPERSSTRWCRSPKNCPRSADLWTTTCPRH